MKRKRLIRNRIKYILIAFTILCLGIIVVTYARGYTIRFYKDAANTLISPFQKQLLKLNHWVDDKVDLLKNKENLLDEVEALKKRNEELENAVLSFANDQHELKRLKELLELKENYSNYSTISANIIGKDSGKWYHRFKIDCGANDGLAVDMNVIANGGLVGIITEVGENYAMVTSIIDDTMNVYSMSEKTLDNCIVSGDLELLSEGHIRILQMNKEAKVENNDIIVTSSISSKFLPGLLIGFVHDLSIDANNITKSGHLVPKVDFLHLQEVLVITDLKK